MNTVPCECLAVFGASVLFDYLTIVNVALKNMFTKVIIEI